METTERTYDENCPENTGIEEVWSGEILLGYRVFMSKEEYEEFVANMRKKIAKQESDEHFKRHLASLGSQ